ncbi:MAG: enoyl-CoA hydratase [Actinomycetota bacterium]|nr:enoyl-CoA hydratase [Acidimicrobiia bacterium]MDQ3293602.1 enoyl-CoA hydratase [Actinomycetota bacterium]
MSRVLLDVADRVATVTLNDPDRRNALDLGLCDDIVAAFDELEGRDDVGAVVVTGAPPAFCAGADLSHLGASEREGLLAVYEGFLRVGRCPLPTIAAVNGAAVGAGMNLALVCDLRLAGRSARFDTRFLQLGLHPGGGHTWMFRRITGPQAVFAAVVFGEVLSAEEAERCGLVWRCHDDDALLPAAQAMAGRAANGPPGLVVRMKESIAAMADIDEHRPAVERELEPQIWSVRQPAFQERLAALKAKISKNS